MYKGGIATRNRNETTSSMIAPDLPLKLDKLDYEKEMVKDNPQVQTLIEKEGRSIIQQANGRSNNSPLKETSVIRLIFSYWATGISEDSLTTMKESVTSWLVRVWGMRDGISLTAEKAENLSKASLPKAKTE